MGSFIIGTMTASLGGGRQCFVFGCPEISTLTWHLMPARLQVHVSGSQNTRQSQPQSSRERRMARSSCFSSTSIFFTPEARSRALRFFVGKGCRKTYDPPWKEEHRLAPWNDYKPNKSPEPFSNFAELSNPLNSTYARANDNQTSNRNEKGKVRA